MDKFQYLYTNLKFKGYAKESKYFTIKLIRHGLAYEGMVWDYQKKELWCRSEIFGFRNVAILYADFSDTLMNCLSDLEEFKKRLAQSANPKDVVMGQYGLIKLTRR